MVIVEIDMETGQAMVTDYEGMNVCLFCAKYQKCDKSVVEKIRECYIPCG